MEIKEIEKLITSYIDQSIGGLDKEHPKFDFKRKWYDLTSNQDINEFLKDTTGIVNTVGLDGFIVIGFDDNKKEFEATTFRDSKLRDTSDIINLINKKVDTLFDLTTFDTEINGNKLSVIHIPPSINKPHVIRLFQTLIRMAVLKKMRKIRSLFVKTQERFPLQSMILS